MTMQLAVLLTTVVTGYRAFAGYSITGIEKYCPFGGFETAYSLFTNRRFTCAAGELNFTLFIALLVLTFLSRKSFCSWVCPFGTVSEWLMAAGRKIFKGRGGRRQCLEPPPGVDRSLRWLRLPILAVTLFFTYKTGELIFRGYDPYYILFSFHGHDVKPWSYAVLAILFGGALLVPMAWCRYLCPLGGALWPLSAVGRLRLKRVQDSCIGCGACDKVCPHSIEVSAADEVRSGECTLCLDCVAACGSNKAIELRAVGLGP